MKSLGVAEALQAGAQLASLLHTSITVAAPRMDAIFPIFHVGKPATITEPARSTARFASRP